MQCILTLCPCVCRLHGSYEALKYGTTLDGLADMTGGITETLSIREDATGAGHTIGRLLEQTSIITATVQTGSQVNGLREQHSVERITGKQVSTKHDTV